MTWNNHRINKERMQNMQSGACEYMRHHKVAHYN